MTDDFFF